MDRAAVDINLHDAVEVLRRRHINFFFNEGSLLGLIRDGKLIEWDHDIDISVFSAGDLSINLINDFKLLGFQAKFAPLRRPGFPPLKLFREGGRAIDIGVYEEVTFGKQTFRVHLWFATDKFRPSGISSKTKLLLLRALHRLLFSIRFGWLRRARLQKFLEEFPEDLHTALSRKWGMDATIGYFIKSEFLEDLTELNFQGTLCPIPREAAEVLEGLYGENWRKPHKATRWTDYLKNPPRA